MYLLILQRLITEAILDVFYFPLWWYTGGAKHCLFKVIDALKTGNDRLAPGLWLKNIFVPMFGQYDWEGRIISFVMRGVQIFFRTIALVIWLSICLIGFFAYLIFPGLVVFGLSRAFAML